MNRHSPDKEKMTTDSILVLTRDTRLAEGTEALLPEGYTPYTLTESPPPRSDGKPPALVLLDSAILQEEALSAALKEQVAGHGVVLLLREDTDWQSLNPLLPEIQLLSVLHPPFVTPAHRQILASALEHARRHRSPLQLRQALTEAHHTLNQRAQELNVIYTVGSFIASSLDTDEVLRRIVEVSVNLTQAEEGFIYLCEGDKLFLRTAKNMDDDIARRFHVEARDENAWRVMRSGRPVMLKRQVRIATGYLVRALLYVPLEAPNQGVVGVLAVVNRERDKGFSEPQLFTLSSLADFAGTMLQNARLFETVQAEQRRIRTILQQAQEAILVTDEDDRLVLWSQTAGEIFSIPPDAATQPITQMIQNSALLELFAEVADGNHHPHTEIVLNEEQVFNAQLTAVPGLGRVIVMQDITHLKALDRLKSEFVSTVSHDLRTPLTTIQGYVELLERVGPLNEMQQRFIEKTLGSLSHITELIGDLLDIGRIEAGYDLEMRPLRLDTLIGETCLGILDQARQARIDLVWQERLPPLWVTGNQRRLRQVLHNLISNALKYNVAGGFVRVEAREDNAHIVVSVVDNGLGIPLHEQPLIFERFYRVQNDQTEDIPGTGLGLAIVKSVIEKHRGRVWVKSAPGEGSTFSFILPSYTPEGEEPDPRSNHAS